MPLEGVERGWLRLRLAAVSEPPDSAGVRRLVQALEGLAATATSGPSPSPAPAADTSSWSSPGPQSSPPLTPRTSPAYAYAAAQLLSGGGASAAAAAATAAAAGGSGLLVGRGSSWPLLQVVVLGARALSPRPADQLLGMRDSYCNIIYGGERQVGGARVCGGGGGARAARVHTTLRHPYTFTPLSRLPPPCHLPASLSTHRCCIQRYDTAWIAR